MPSIRKGNRRRLAMIQRSNRRMVSFDIESCGFGPFRYDGVLDGFRVDGSFSYKPVGDVMYASTGESRPASDLLYENDARSKFADMARKDEQPNDRTFGGGFEVDRNGILIMPNRAFDIIMMEQAFSLFSKPDEGISAEHALRMGAMPSYDDFVAGLPDELPSDQQKG
jgi:hypothetical protein